MPILLSDNITLTEDLFYGNGRHKKCYVHPTNENLCVKIAYNRGGTNRFIA